MTPNQIKLARHALGLPNSERRSYRNYFTCGPGHQDHADWAAMVGAGDAITEKKRPGFGGDDIFWVTFSGAQKALLPKEQLDAEDWPEKLKANQ